MKAYGHSVGLIKIRVVRPFPRKELRDAAADLKAIGVLDRNVSFGWNTGIIYQEVSSALFGLPLARLPFIAGLGGEDITIEMVVSALERICQAVGTTQDAETVWLRPNVEGRQQ